MRSVAHLRCKVDLSMSHLPNITWPMIRAAATPQRHVPAYLVARGDEPVTLTAAAGDEAKKLRQFSMVAYTGGRLNLRNYAYPVVIDLAGLRVSAKSRPVLRDHEPSQIVGHTDAIDTGAGRIVVKGTVSGGNTAAAEVIAAGDNGFPWQASVGAIPEKMVFVAEGEKVVINGRSLVGPLYVARKSVLAEVSFVPLGADDQTTVKIAAAAAGSFIEVTTMNFEEWLKAMGFDLATLTEAQKAGLQAKFDAEQATPPGKIPPVKAGANGDQDGDDDEPADPVADMRASAATETRRIAAVRKTCAGKHPDIEAKAIEEGWNAEKAELEVLRASRSQAGPAIHTGSQDASAAAIEAALCLTGGLAETEVAKVYDEKTMNAAVSRPLRKFSLSALMFHVIQAAGLSARPGRITDEHVETALRADRMLKASGGFSTVSLSGTLGNVANKVLLSSFTAVQTVYQYICYLTDAPDFKAQTSYRLNDEGVFEEVGATGELKHTALSDESFTNKLKTFGRILTLTRQHMINDDLSAFLQIPRLLGRQAALALESGVFKLLLSNPSSFFHADNKNYIEGADTALNVDSLTAAEQKFLDQTDADGRPILTMAKTLLLPTTIKVAGETLMKAPVMLQVPASNKAAPAQNPHAGKWTPVCSPYLNALALSGSSSTAWYLFGDPEDVAAMEVSFLQGARTPTIESAEADFNVLGMNFRGYFDFGIAMKDHRGAVKSKGAA